MGSFSKPGLRSNFMNGWFTAGAIGRGAQGYTNGAGSPTPAPAPSADTRITAAGDTRVTSTGDERVVA